MNRCKSVLAGLACTSVLALAAWQSVVAQPYGYPPYGPPGYRPPYPAAQQQQPARQEGASVTIHAPQDGATLSRGEQLVLDYAVDTGPSGDHVHVYVDGREVAIVRELQGSYTVGRLPPGTHEVAIKIVNRAHVPIGVEEAVSVTVR